MLKCGETRYSARIKRLSQGPRPVSCRPRTPDPSIARPALPHYDLHCHSTYSDGLLPPAAVVARAAARGVDVLALTDHDEVGGIAEARAAAADAGITLVCGSELSTSWDDVTVHVIALGIDPRNAHARAGPRRDSRGALDAGPAHGGCTRGIRHRGRLRGRDEVRDERAARLAHAFRALPRRGRLRARTRRTCSSAI